MIILMIGFALPAMAQTTLNVMTFNIRLDVPVDSLNGWQYRRDHLVSQVLFQETNILSVQEALNNQMKDLQERLPGFKYAGVARDNNKQWGEYNAIFYDTARLKLIEQNTFWLSKNIRAVGVKGWDAAYPRIVTWAKFKDQKTKKIFYLFNTHFDNEGQVARRESALLLLKKVKEIAGLLPAIITGDFNSHPGDEPIQIITDKNNPLHLTDSKAVSATPHYGPKGTFNNFKKEESEPIDYIFIKNKVKVLKHATLSESWNGRFSSDHFPVFAKVSI
jgi:endonuclease/exonuclease/phosphatase family metal-dependent hydrolase